MAFEDIMKRLQQNPSGGGAVDPTRSVFFDLPDLGVSTTQPTTKQPTPPKVNTATGGGAVDPTRTVFFDQPDLVGVQQTQPQQQQQQQFWQIGQLGQVPSSLDSIIKSLGGGPKVTPPPELQVDADYVNRIMEQWGVRPRSEEEIAEIARASVERMAMERRQLVQREIERFEREHEHEFAKAKELIRREAETVKADYQEEFAARGMYYSSVMASALGEVDAKSTEMIAEIARDAANRLADLHADLRDIAEWQIVEEEVLRHQLMQEDQELRKQLAVLSTEVAFKAQQVALDRWYQQQQLELQAYAQRVQTAQLRAQQAIQQGQFLALAFMVNDPEIKNYLTSIGMTEDKWNSLSLEMQAGVVSEAINFNATMAEIKHRQLNNEYLAGQIANYELNAYRDLTGEQAAMQVQTAIDSITQLYASKKELKDTDKKQINAWIANAETYIHLIMDPVLKRNLQARLDAFKSEISDPKKQTDSKPSGFNPSYSNPYPIYNPYYSSSYPLYNPRML